MRDSLRSIASNIKTALLIVAASGTIVCCIYAYAVMTVDDMATNEGATVVESVPEVAQDAQELSPVEPVAQAPGMSPALALPHTPEPAPVFQPGIQQAYQVVQTVNGTFLIPIGAAVPWLPDSQPEMEDEG